jgi:putative transposase
MAFKQTHQFHEAKFIHEAKFRSKRSPNQSIFIPKSAVNIHHGVYHTILENLKSYEPYPQPQGDCRLTLESGRWFVCVPIATDTKTENQGRAVAIDPGVRTFATFYSLESCGKLGTGDFSRIQRLCHHLDNLISRMSKAVHKQKYKMKQAVKRLRWKIRDLIDELHHKTALFLSRTLMSFSSQSLKRVT